METVLIISQTIILVAFALFYAKREKEQGEHIKSLEEKLTTKPIELQQKFIELSIKREAERDKLTKEILSSHLKHIQSLEKTIMSFFSKPVSQRLIKEVLDTSPRDIIENEIDKVVDDSIEINDQNFSKLPIGRNTKVVIENGGDMSDSDFPTEVID